VTTPLPAAAPPAPPSAGAAIVLPAVQATAATTFEPATRPTMYFIGVTTGKSSIMQVFPKWAAHLGLGAVAIRGIDCKWHDDPAVYRHVVTFIKHDPLSLGALVTTHKIDLLTACRDLFDELDPYAGLLGEVSGIAKREKGDRHLLPVAPGDTAPAEGRGLQTKGACPLFHLCGYAKDPITSGLSLEAFLPADHWRKTGGDTLILGAGGSSIALSCAMLDKRHGDNLPRRLFVTNRSPGRLHEIEAIHRKLSVTVPVEYIHTPKPEDNDRVLARLAPHSLVANATGLGKDAPGSPLTDAAVFPEHGLAWDFNYRGDLHFLVQARRQAAARRLHVEDGWVYFLHGWTRVMEEVFHVEIPARGPGFDALGQVAASTRS
jgi:shikimate 5-dehydrogenase